MPCRLVPCDLGDPGWGDPWFPHGTFVASLTFWYGLVMFLFFCLFLLPYQVGMIQCYHLLHNLAHELVLVTLVLVWSLVAVFCFWFVFLFVVFFLSGRVFVTTFWTVHEDFLFEL